MRRLLREPLVHFLALGSLLFVIFQWSGGGTGVGSRRIVITPGQIDSIAASFMRTWMRPATEQELKAQLDDFAREEIAAREAIAMGLDRDDTVIRRRLRQKFEFLVEDAIDLAPPTDAQLQAWLDAHADAFRVEPVVTFRQITFNSDRRGANPELEARATLARISADGASAATDSLGDTRMLPREVQGDRHEIARLFGESFADEVLKIDPGRWAGPLRSGYGMHLVFVRERQEGRRLSLAEARPQVEREFTLDRRRRQLDAIYTKLLDRYRIVIEKPAVPSSGGSPYTGAAK